MSNISRIPGPSRLNMNRPVGGGAAAGDWRAKFNDLEIKYNNLKNTFDEEKVKKASELSNFRQELQAAVRQSENATEELKQVKEHLYVSEEELSNAKASAVEFKREQELKMNSYEKKLASEQNKFSEKLTNLQDENHIILQDKLQTQKENVNLRLEVDEIRCKLKTAEEKIEILTKEVETIESERAANVDLRLTCDKLAKQIEDNEENIRYNATMRQKIEQLNLLEKENKKLLIENNELKIKDTNVQLLQEERDHFQQVAQSSTALRAQLATIESERDALRLEVENWREQFSLAMDTTPSDKQLENISTLAKQLNRLRRENMLLTDELGELRSKYNVINEQFNQSMKNEQKQEKQEEIIASLKAQIDAAKERETIFTSRYLFYRSEMERYDNLTVKHGSQCQEILASNNQGDQYLKDEVLFLRQQLIQADQLIEEQKILFNQFNEKIFNENNAASLDNRFQKEEMSIQVDLERELIVELR